MRDKELLKGIAPLRNVILARQLMEHLSTRAPNLPGMGVLYGPSGYGKTSAVASVAATFGAVYVACRSYFTRRSFLLSILEEMGVKPGRTVHDMVGLICEQLALSRKPLIIDEVDHIVERNLVELMRDIYEGSGAAVLMVGEEKFPVKLKRWERVHNRVLNWQMAQPSDLDDARKLVKLYSPDVPIGDDLIRRIVQETRGVTRRICVNIETVRQEAKKTGATIIDLKAWGARGFDNGEAPTRRVA